ncbi:MAG: serine acetyltransferase [Anaerolineaceae bacterium]|nr:serine acetyltransferase [Anaerolineaceae bacterium]
MHIQFGALGLISESYTISFLSTLRNIHSDMQRYHATENRSYPALLIMSPGMIASIYYRLGHWLWHTQGVPEVVLYILRPLYLLGKRLIEVYSGISVSPRAKIGRGFYIQNFGSIYVGASVIGDNCSICQEVSIGNIADKDSSDIPVLGDRVFIGAGGKVIEPVSVGNDVAIGANTVVMSDLADCAVAVGVPANTISYKGSFEFVIYNTMDSDPKRLLNRLGRDQREMINETR